MEEKHDKNKDEHVYSEGGYGWVIIFAIILLNISLLTLIYCFGIIFRDEFEQMGITAAKTSFLLHLQSSLFCLVGVGQGVLMPCTYLATNWYFKKRLTLAISISTTGASIFSIFSPKICDILLTKVKRKYTVLILFFISLLSFVGCFLLKPVNEKCDEEELTKLDSKKPQEVPVNATPPVYKETTHLTPKKEDIFSKIINIFDLQLLKQTPYTISVVCLGISFAAELNMILMMQFVLPELSHFDRSDVANVTSVQFIFDIIGRLIIPVACHFIGASPKWIYASALIAATGARTLLATYAHSYTAVYVAVCIIGVTKGLRAVYQSLIVPKLVPLDKFVAANGFQMFFTGATSLVVGPIIGVIHDTWNSYIPALHTSSILSCACVLLWILELIFSKKDSNAER